LQSFTQGPANGLVVVNYEYSFVCGSRGHRKELYGPGVDFVNLMRRRVESS
jgi:hypothetical protein